MISGQYVGIHPREDEVGLPVDVAAQALERRQGRADRGGVRAGGVVVGQAVRVEAGGGHGVEQLGGGVPEFGHTGWGDLDGDLGVGAELAEERGEPPYGLALGALHVNLDDARPPHLILGE